MKKQGLSHPTAISIGKPMKTRGLSYAAAIPPRKRNENRKFRKIRTNMSKYSVTGGAALRPANENSRITRSAKQDPHKAKRT